MVSIFCFFFSAASLMALWTAEGTEGPLSIINPALLPTGTDFLTLAKDKVRLKLKDVSSETASITSRHPKIGSILR